MIIVVHNHKGGIGKTTLTAHMAFRANVLGIKCLVVTLDRQGDLLRWFPGAEKDPKKVFKLGNITVVYSPDQMPPQDILDAYPLVLVDTPPKEGVPAMVNPGLWVAQIDNRTAVENLATVLPEFLKQAPVYLVFYRADVGGELMLRGLQDAARTLKQVEFCPLVLENAPSTARAQYNYKPVWEVPWGKGTDAAKDMIELCDLIFKRAGVLGDGRKASR